MASSPDRIHEGSTPQRADLAAVLGWHELAPVGWEAARTAAAFLRDARPDDLRIEAKSTPTDAVTVMDRGAEERIVDILLRHRPADGLLGEEGGEREGTSGIRWVVDPLDGTVNYLYRLPMWAVSIAAEVDGRTEVGIVIAPALGEAYVAIAGRGAWAIHDSGAAERIRASGVQDPAMALLATGYSYDPDRRARQADAVRGIITGIRDVRRLGAAVIDFCWTARGRLDGYYESGLQPWDIAAGALIAREAGCVVCSIKVGTDDQASVAALAPGIAASVGAMLRSADAAQAG